MILIQFNFNIPRITTGMLHDKYKMVAIRTGLFTVLWIDERASELFKKCLRDGVYNSEWLIENIGRVRLAERKGLAKGRAQGKSEFQSELAYYKDAYHKADDERINLHNEVRQLERAFSILTKRQGDR